MKVFSQNADLNGCKANLFGVDVAEQLNLISFSALFDFMMLGKFIPALFLGGRQHSGATTKRANVVERIENRRSDEFRAVGHGLQNLEQVRVNFKRYGIGFFQSLPPECRTMLYLFYLYILPFTQKPL